MSTINGQIVSAYSEISEVQEEDRSTLRHPDELLRDALGATELDSGETVTSSTALRVIAVYRCISIVASAIAKLPLRIYRRKGEDERETRRQHPTAGLFSFEANPTLDAYRFRKTMQSHCLTNGNAYAWIERDAGGMARALWPRLPGRMKVEAAGDRLVYIYQPAEGGEEVYQADDVLHLAGLGFDGISGYSPIALARQAIGLASAAERTGSRVFGQGAIQRGILESDKRLDDDQIKNLRESWQMQAGGSRNAMRTPILEGGIKFSPISVPLEDLQFIAARRFQVTEIARLYGVPPHLLGDLEKASYNSVELLGLEFRSFTLDDWAQTWESESNRKIIPVKQRGTHYFEHDFNAMLKTDSKARSEIYRNQFSIGALSQNEIRKLENMQPIGPDGDRFYVPSNLIPADKADELGGSGGGTGGEPDPAQQIEEDLRSRILAAAELQVETIAKREAAKEIRRIREAGGKYLDRSNEPEAFIAAVERYYRGAEAYLEELLGPVAETVAATGDPPRPGAPSALYGDYGARGLELLQELTGEEIRSLADRWQERAAELAEVLKQAIGVK